MPFALNSVMLGLIISNSKADLKLPKVLMVDPGEYKPAIALFINGFKVD